MSYIQSVSFHGIKGVSKQYNLGPITYVYGPNKSNKTTIVDAIKVALLGYYPRPDIPKTNAGTMRLASGAEMAAGVLMHDGRNINRIYRLRSGKIEKETTPEGFEIDPRLALCLDHSLYFGKTDAEKVQQIINMAQGMGDDAKIPATLTRIKSLRATDHNGQAELALHTLIKDLPKPEKKPVQWWLAEVLEYAKERRKQANASLKEFMGANRSLSEANAIDSLMNDSQKSETEQRRATLLQKKSAVDQEFGRRKEWYKYYQKALAEKAALETEVQKLRDENMPPEEVERYRSEEQQNTIESKRLSDAAEKYTTEQDALADQSTGLNNSANDFEEQIQFQQEIVAAAQNRVAILQRPKTDSFIETEMVAQKDLLALKQKSQGEIQAITRTMDGIVAHRCCPTCQAEHAGWKDDALRRLQADIDKIKGLIADYDRQSRECQHRINARTISLDKARDAAVKDEEVKRLAAEKEITDLTARKNEIQKALTRLREQWTELGNKARDLRNKAREHSMIAEQARQILDDQKNGLAALKAAEEQLQRIGQIEEVAAPVPPPEMAQIERDIFEVESQLTVHHNQEAERKRIEQLKAVAAEIKARFELAEKIADVAKEEQARIVEGAFEPVLEIANAITCDIVATPLIYSDGQIGRLNEKGSFVSVSTFSGSETLATYMAITAALAQGATDRIGIIDEIGTFDLENIMQLLKNSQAVLQKKMLDQIIIVGTVCPASLPDLVTVIKT